ncbi:flavin monoamine oxidase family protein [Nocardioides panzhihuensis]|uniref:Monoamine oxidase n=1 Tax=Nocardioides panzhihuensis TaxID=860243 RepID=A0A7Z0DNA1_9ACTN|nr:FAD-dependent oxidoreductase [Nocardioides panzhihuensis]NYI78540.1 monoamine oxidase [Nocardioides panzhihuensis]
MSALPRRCQVVVVGAGYAGLATAIELREAGVDVVVLEAADRVGGRIWSERRDGVVVDHGGQWVGPTQTRLLAWAERFGCPTFQSYDVGRHVEIWADGTTYPFTSDQHSEGPGVEDYERLEGRLDALAATIDLADPLACSSLEEWDSQTVHSWVDAHVDSPAARRRLALAVQGVWSCEPRDLSMFHLLFYVAGAGGMRSLMETIGYAQDSRFVDGAQAPALAAAASLGGRVHVRTPVSAIRQGDDAVTVETARGNVRADRVVVTSAPAATSHIEFEPALPTSRRRWLASSVMGDVAKVHLRYDSPFWREDGLSGQMVAYDAQPVGVVFDNSPDDGSRGVLVCFTYGDRYRTFAALDPGERRTAVLDVLGRVFGPQAMQPLDYVEQLWPEDRWAEGGYAAVPVPGAWLEHARDGWRTPCGRVHWAGTETATVWNGYMDGAIRSGERAAAEVTAALAAESPGAVR